MDNIRGKAKNIYNKKIKNKPEKKINKDEMIRELNIQKIELELKNQELIEEKEKIKKERDKCEELFQLSPMAYLNLDERYRVKECNLRSTELFAMPKTEILGTPFTIFLDKKNQKYFHKIIKGRKSKEIRMKSKVKNIKKREIDVIMDIIKLERDKIFIGITDISSIKTLSDRYNMLMQESSDYILITDKNGEIENYNKKADDLFNISLRKNNNIYDLLERTKSKEELDKLGNSSKKIIKYNEKKENNNIYLSWIYKRLGSEGDYIFQHVFHDVTKLIENVKKLEEINRQKNDFIETITHDLKNPLNAIIGFSEVLKEENLSDQTMEEIDLILKSGHTLKDLIDGILELSKISNHGIKINNEKHNFYEEMKYIIEVLNVTAKQKNLYLKLSYKCDKKKKYNFDKRRIFQIISNIIGNAIKFTYEGGIDVVVKKVDESKEYDKLEIKISDTGIGIDKKDIKNIFKKFTRGQNVKKIDGTGIGLSVVKKLIKILGGGITIESKIGKGTTLTVVLPFEKIKNKGE